MYNVPWMDTITLTNANTAYQLHALLIASEPTLPQHAQALVIQADYNAPGTAQFLIGGIKMQTTPTSYGILLLAGSSFSLDSMSSNIIILPQIYLSCNTAGQTMHVVVVTR